MKLCKFPVFLTWFKEFMSWLASKRLFTTGRLLLITAKWSGEFFCCGGKIINCYTWVYYYKIMQTREVLIEAHPLQRWHALAEVQDCRKHLDVWSCIRGGSLLLQHPQKWVNKYSWEDWKCRVHGLCISVPPPRNAARHSSWLFLPGMCCYSDKRETRVMFLLPQKSGFALCWIAWRQTHSEFGKQIS